MSFKQSFSYLFGLFSLLVSLLGFAEPANPSLIEVNEDDNIILELKLERYVIADAIVAYHNVDYTLLSFEEFIQAIDYPIEMDFEEGWASGWFIEESQTFELKLRENELFIAGKPIALRPGFAYAKDDWGLYIDVRDLEQWFDLDISLLMDRLQLLVTSEVEQPIEKKIAREKKREKTHKPTKQTERFPVIEDRYQGFGNPVFDIRASTDQTQDDETHAFSLQGSGDILFHEMRVSHTQSSGNQPPNTRLTFYRDAVKEGDDIALGLTAYSLGDIYSQGDSLVSNSTTGVGFQVERSLSQSVDESFSSRDIEGDAPPGWEVELYRNDLLIDFQTVDDSGRYIFEDVALQFGENHFEIRIFGPQGQKEIRSERLSIGTQLVNPGEWQLFASFLEKNRALIGSANAGPVTNDVKDDLNLSLYYGLATEHTLGIGFNRTSPSNQGEERDYARLSWIGAFSYFTSRLDYAYDVEGEGHGASLDITGRVLGQSFSFTQRVFEDFISSKNSLGAITDSTELNLFGSINGGLPYSVGLSATSYQDGLVRYKGEQQISVTMKGVRLSNQLNAFGDNQGSPVATTGLLSAAAGRGMYQTRAALSYDPAEGEPLSLSIGQTIKKNDWRVQLQLNSTYGDQPRNALSLSASAFWKDAAFSLSLQGADDDTYAVGLSLEIGVHTVPHKPFIHTSRSGGVSAGRAQAVVFMDNDANLKWSEGDTPLPNIRFKGRSSWEERQTDEEGKVLLPEIDTKRGSVLHLDAVTLGDPYLQPFMPSVKLMSHAGALQTIYFPVNETIEVEGNVLASLRGRIKGVGGVPVALFRDGVKVKQVRSEFDGYYLFTGVLPGLYTVNVVDEKQVMTDYEWQASDSFNANMEEGIYTVDDIVLRNKNDQAPEGSTDNKP